MLPTLERHAIGWLVGVTLLAVAVRLWGLDFGLPFAAHPDESRYLFAAVGIVQSGDFNPGWFHQPSLYTYLLTALVALYAPLQSIPYAELFRPPYHFDGLIGQPDLFLLGRLLTVAFGSATVALVFWLGRRWSGLLGGIVAATLLALSVFHVASSHYIATDVPVAFFTLAALAVAARLATTGARRDYWLLGIVAGLAIGTKYSAYVLAVPATLAHLAAWRAGRVRLLTPRLFELGVITAVVFLLTTPYALLDTTQFLHDVRLEWTHHKVLGHIGAEGNSGGWLLVQLLTRSDRWLTLAGVVGFGAALWRRHLPLMLLFVFTAVYFASMAANIVRFERFLIPLLPPLALAAGYAVRQASLYPPLRRRPALIPLLALLLLVEPVLGTWRVDQALSATDSRTVARQWLAENAPADARVAVETYGPDLDATIWDPVYFSRLSEHPPDYYRQQGFDYVISAEARYSAVYRDPDRYPDLIAAYEDLFDSFELVATLNGAYVDRPQSAIRIYRP